jgi:hypothetical protein
VRNLLSDVRFSLAEAVADDSSASRFFLPHRNPQIVFFEDVPGIIKIDDFAFGIATEAIRSGLEASKRHFR